MQYKTYRYNPFLTVNSTFIASFFTYWLQVCLLASAQCGERVYDSDVIEVVSHIVHTFSIAHYWIQRQLHDHWKYLKRYCSCKVRRHSKTERYLTRLTTASLFNFLVSTVSVFSSVSHRTIGQSERQKAQKEAVLAEKQLWKHQLSSIHRPDTSPIKTEHVSSWDRKKNWLNRSQEREEKEYVRKK